MFKQFTLSNNKLITGASISALVRGDDKTKVLESKGYQPVLFDGIDCTDQLKAIASHFDGMGLSNY